MPRPGPRSCRSEDVASRLRVAVNRLQRRLRREALGGLSPGQASALGTVRRLGHPTLGELAAEEQVQPPSMTRIVGLLVAAGLVSREADAADRRSVHVRITPEGERALQRIRRCEERVLGPPAGRARPRGPPARGGAGGAARAPLGPTVRRRIREAGRRTFRSISVRNYRLYFTGQVISVSGTWMQTVAQAYLILFPLHGTGLEVAIATSLQFVPMLLLGPFGGLVADRYDKRRVLYATQGSAGVLALILGLLAATGSVQLWQVYVLAAGLGFVNLFDNPARQTFVFELVGPELLPNAISLNSVLINGARVIGPAIGGVLIVTVGVATCFMVNAGSYLAVIVALAMMDASRLNRRPGVVRAKGQIREGLRYAWGTRELRDTLLAMAVVGVFAFNFTVTLPLLAKFTFHGGAGLASVFMAAMGAGAVVGGLFTAFRSRPSTRLLACIGLVFGASILAVAVSPTALVATATARRDGRGGDLVRGHEQRDAPAPLRSGDARPCHVPERHRLPRQHTDRGTAPRRDQRCRRARGWRFALGGVATLLASVPLFALSRTKVADRRQRHRSLEPKWATSGTHEPQPRGAVRPA